MYACGGFNFPTSTGAFSVTGLGFRPVGVVMLGGNKATVGSLLTGLPGPGLFVSLNALDYSDGVTVLSTMLAPCGQSAVAGNLNYRAISTGPISMSTDAVSAGTVDYKASAISFDADGFTLTVATAAPGVRPIHWFAFGGEMSIDDPTLLVSAAAKQIMSGFTPTFDAGFVARSALVLSTLSFVQNFDTFVDDNSWFSFGTGNWPAAAVVYNNTASSIVYTDIQRFSPLGRQGFEGQYVAHPSSVVDFDTSADIDALGPVLIEGRRHFHPTVMESSEMTNNGAGLSTWEYCMWWNGEGWTDGVGPVAVGGSVTITVPPHVGEIQQVMFSSANGWGIGSNPEVRFAFGMLHPDYQGCVAFGPDGSFFQSVDRCMAVCNSSGRATVSGSIAGRTFTLTHREGGTFPQVTYHVWGSPAAGWVPHVYRWWDRKRGGPRLA